VAIRAVQVKLFCGQILSRASYRVLEYLAGCLSYAHWRSRTFVCGYCAKGTILWMLGNWQYITC